MKQVITLSLFIVLLFSCQKETPAKKGGDPMLENIYRGLKDSLTSKTFLQLDWKKIVRDHVDTNKITVVRIGFMNKSMATDFVVVKMKATNLIEKGRIIHISRGNGTSVFNGSILVQSLKGDLIVSSSIDKGFITAWRHIGRTSSQENPYIELPGVTVVCTYPPAGGVTYTSWYSIMTLFNDNYTSGGSGYYGTSDPFASGGGGSGTGSTQSTGVIEGVGGTAEHPTVNYLLIDEPTMAIDFEDQYANDAIDLDKYLKCFTAIPDANATCLISIFTDIPVDGDPTVLFSWSNGSPGHTFIKLEKRNGGQIAAQNIGFYPKTGWKVGVTSAPVEGKWVDNSLHEYNAMIEQPIQPQDLATTITHILYLARFVKYDIDDYNCTDWALNVFNDAVGSNRRIDIPRYQIPDGEAPNGTSTPQGLYVKLKQLKEANDPMAPKITIPVIGWAGHSSGPCN